MYKSIKNHAAALSLALATSALLIGAVHADDLAVSKTTAVSMAGIDLSTAAGADAARQRVQQAAKKLCLSFYDDLDLGHTAHYSKCMDRTVAQSMTRIDALVSKVNAENRVAVNLER